MYIKFNQSGNTGLFKSILLGIILVPIILVGLFSMLPVLLVIMGVFIIFFLVMAGKFGKLKKASDGRFFYYSSRTNKAQNDKQSPGDGDFIDVEYKTVEGTATAKEPKETKSIDNG